MRNPCVTLKRLSTLVGFVVFVSALCGFLLSAIDPGRGSNTKAFILKKRYPLQGKEAVAVTFNKTRTTDVVLHNVMDQPTNVTTMVTNGLEKSIIHRLVVAEEENLVVYNRVPKCGSRSVIAIFNELAKFYHYGYTHSTEFWKQRFNEHDEAALVDRISALPKPRVFDMHVHFLNFSKYGQKKPIYINVIRDPLRRLVSAYYFNRFGDSINKYMVSKFKGTEQERNQTYDECVLLNKTECQLERAWYIIPFFCGQDPRCRQPLKWSLEEAKRHVINEYTFVGILEDLENTMRIFEYLLPKYLKGAVSILKSLDKRKHLMKSLKQPGVLPSENVTRLMRARLTLEYEFYDFVVERFNRTKLELGLS